MTDISIPKPENPVCCICGSTLDGRSTMRILFYVVGSDGLPLLKHQTTDGAEPAVLFLFDDSLFCADCQPQKLIGNITMLKNKFENERLIDLGKRYQALAKEIRELSDLR